MSDSVEHQFEKERICLGNVHEGDHLIFPGIDGLHEHHAICTYVGGNVIEITEYTDDDLSSSGLGKVRTRTVSYQELEEEQVVKLKCLTESPLSNRETVERAESRVGENSYNIFNSNCEHFAWWCKYGLSVSLQLQYKFKKWALNIARQAYCSVPKAAVKTIAVKVLNPQTNPYLVKVIANVSDEVAGLLLANARAVGFVVGGAIEAFWTAYEIYKANKMRKKGVITTEQFRKQTAAVCVKTTCRFGGGVARSVIGSALGPVGSVVGGAIGAAVGHIVGSFLGWLFG